MNKRGVLGIVGLLVAACCVVTGLAKPTERVKAENTNYVLQDSVFYESPGNKGTNCYGYAIGVYNDTRSLGSAPFFGSPGFKSNKTYQESWTMEEIADAVYTDLMELGCKNIVVSTTMPQVNESQRLICVRTGQAGGNTYFHFMRYDVDDGYWYHKPGTEGDILRYKYKPTNDRAWESNYIDTITGEILYYDSEIYYIRYTNIYNGWTGYCEIRNYDDLNQIRNYPEKSCELKKSITVPTGEIWTPIQYFHANFQGNGHTIDGLTMVSNTVSDYGFIKNLNEGGTVENIKFNNIVIRLEETSDLPLYVNIGVIAAKNDGIIDNCTVGNSSVRKTYLHSGVKANVGGICGINLRDINNCTVNYLEATAVGYLGGIAGVTETALLNCTVNNSKLKLYCGAVGGIVGYSNDKENIANFIVNCKVNSTEISCYNGYPRESEYYASGLDGYAGGLIGYNNRGNLMDCSIKDSKISYAGDKTDSRSFAPAMGLLCGVAASGVNVNGTVEGDTKVDTGNLQTVTWKGGFLNLVTYTHDQRKNAGGNVGKRV